MNLRHDSRMNPALEAPVLPARFANCTIGALSQGLLADTTRSYLMYFWRYAAEGKAPVFLGKTQQWKTYAAAVILKSIHVNLTVRTMFVGCPTYFARLERDRFSENTQGHVRRMTRIPFLVMDDFADVRAKTFGSDLLIEVASARHYQQLPTLWTGNIAGKDIKEKYGANFARRMQEGSEGLALQF